MSDALSGLLADLTPEDRHALRTLARHQCWRSADLSYKLHPGQREISDAMRDTPSRRWCMEISRKWGKSYFLVTKAAEVCLRKPRSRVVYGAPTLKHLEEFIIPVLSEVAEDAPDDCRPVFNSSTGHWTFPNGSWVHLFGADNEGKADRGRGPKAELAVFDEAGFPPTGILSYVIRSIFRPSLMLSPGSMTILASTPARVPDHDFSRLCDAAEQNGVYFRRTIHDNPLLTEAQIQEEIDGAAKDEGMTVEEYTASTDFRREYLAQRVTDSTLMVMGGDWEALREVALVEHERPQFFDAYETIDFGGADPRAALFGFYDFRAGCLVIEDEVNLRNNEATDELADAIRAKEKELYGTSGWDGTLRAVREEKMDPSVFEFLHPDERAKLLRSESAPLQPYLRTCDHDVQTAIDLHRRHGISVVPADKGPLVAAVNEFRVALRQGRIKVDPRCRDLDRQLRTAEWTSPRATDWKRKNGEHADLVWCAIYLWKSIRQHKNPVPASHGFDRDGMYRRPPPPNPLRALVGGKRR